MKKVTFIMAEPDPKKHSTRFDFEAFETAEDATDKDFLKTATAKAFKPSFYIPAPFMDAKRIRVTIEEI